MEGAHVTNTPLVSRVREKGGVTCYIKYTVALFLSFAEHACQVGDASPSGFWFYLLPVIQADSQTQAG